MEKKIECSYVRDLLPLYIDEIVSDETKQYVTKHLDNCEECREIYQEMKMEVEDIRLKDINNQKNFLKQTKKFLILKAINSMMFLAIVICFIVNLAVEHGLTWFPIAAVSILYGGLIVNTLISSEQHKVFHSMMVISIGLIVLLTTIQVSSYYLLGDTSVWYFKFGLPLAFLWLVIVWIPIVLKKICKFGLFDAFGILFVCILIGNYITKMMLGDITNKAELLDKTLFIQNGLGFFIAAILCSCIGRIYKWKK